MAILQTILAALPLLATSLAAPSQGHHEGLPKDLVAPYLQAHPFAPANFRSAVPQSRHGHGKVCTVRSHTSDTGPHIIAASRSVITAAEVYFPPGDYLIASAVDLTFLQNVDFAIWGNITFLQDSRNGPYWWGQMANDSTTQRPIMFGTDGLHHTTISGLTMRNHPNYDLNLQVDAQPKAVPAKNTDGWDTFRSSNIVIQNSVTVNPDDCVSFKPNSTSVIVQNLSCTGSHGISVGSLGQYIGEVDLVEDLYVYNVTIANAGNFARIKVWAGVEASADGLSEYTGTTSEKYDPRVGYLVCSSPEVRHNIYASYIDLEPPSGNDATYTCVNLKESDLDINCV
ncbi:pectin lyase fold/virulence factor [Aspergillus granulosus]|uniref:galacturonan 1,4-alpha-galacturonidase n=1 Tax=Aspergillus granulosus TaxID=176169 RepID=A0ABR4HEC0_9EURO